MSSLNSRGGWKYSQRTGETTSNGVTAKTRVRTYPVSTLCLNPIILRAYFSLTQQTDVMQLTTTTRPEVSSAKVSKLCDATLEVGLDFSCLPQVFIHVESHELADVDNKNPSRLLPDGESEQEYRQTALESKRDKFESSMV
jgi:hypothetical protein